MPAERRPKSQSFLYGALILSIATGLVKVIGALFKIPIGRMLGEAGSAHFTVAYNIFATLFVISSAGLPVAVSKMVSEAETAGRRREARAIFSVSAMAFILIGTVGALVLFIGAPAFAGIMHDDEAVQAIRAIAPAVFFVGLICPIRGYHQGKGNMLPTAVSQVIEAMGKLVFGLVLLFATMKAGAALPSQAASAILGVTIGTAMAALYLWFAGRPGKARLPDPKVEAVPSRKKILARLIAIALPITISSSILSLGTLIDTSQILGRLQSAAGFSPQEAHDFYGAYSWAITMFNLPPAFILTLSVSIIPAISAARVRNDKKTVNGTIKSSFRVTALLAMPCAAGFMSLAGPILSMLYSNQPSGVRIAAPLLTTLSLAIPFVCLVSLTNAVLQALGLVSIPVVTMLVGVIAKIACNYFLVGNPQIHINGAPISTAVCYGLISLLNIAVILRVTGAGARMLGVFAKPLLASALMGALTRGVYLFLSGHMSNAVSVLGSIAAGALAYLIMALFLRALPRNDLMLIPKGEKLANFLRIR